MTNSDSTYNGKTIRGFTTVTEIGKDPATMRIQFTTEVDNSSALDVGYPDPAVVCAAINAYAEQQGWPAIVFTVDSPADVPAVSGPELEAALGL